jgi:uncharacterized protein
LTVAEPLTADEIIAHLKLAPHPEGGYFRETFRDEPGHKGRSHSTAILYLFRADEVSRWRRRCREVALVRRRTIAARGQTRRGAPRISAGSRLAQRRASAALVPAGAWQTARGLGVWTLMGCTVAPGFDFGGFELAPHDFEP